MKYEEFTDELKQFITKTYLDTYSTTKVIEGVKLHFDPLMGRSSIVSYLKSINLYESACPHQAFDIRSASRIKFS